jgi:hypothetical protein
MRTPHSYVAAFAHGSPQAIDQVCQCCEHDLLGQPSSLCGRTHRAACNRVDIVTLHTPINKATGYQAGHAQHGGVTAVFTSEVVA